MTAGSDGDLLDLHLTGLVSRLADSELTGAGVIEWAAPVPVFGDPLRSRVATLGINPSSREFVDIHGRELVGSSRRLHTRTSLGLASWNEAGPAHIRAVAAYCREYFHRDPFDAWFKRLDAVVAAAGATYYGLESSACHLDLVPYATDPKWTALLPVQRSYLLNSCRHAFASMLQGSGIRVLILNGRTVVSGFEAVAEQELDEAEMPDWELARAGRPGVSGFAKVGVVNTVAGVRLDAQLMVLGFNHNLQSSFGVTNRVLKSICGWVAAAVRKGIHSLS